MAAKAGGRCIEVDSGDDELRPHGKGSIEGFSRERLAGLAIPEGEANDEL